MSTVIKKLNEKGEHILMSEMSLELATLGSRESRKMPKCLGDMTAGRATRLILINCILEKSKVLLSLSIEEGMQPGR